jgi:ribosomal protein L32E
MKASDRQVGGTHYKDMGVQTWDVVDTWPVEQRIGYYRGGALKYLMRMGSKDESPVEIAKGHHYMEKLLELLKEQQHAEVIASQVSVSKKIQFPARAKGTRR